MAMLSDLGTKHYVNKYKSINCVTVMELSLFFETTNDGFYKNQKPDWFVWGYEA